MNKHLVKNYFFQQKKVYIIAECILLLFMLFLALNHTYNDLLITAKQGMKFWDVLFAGKPLSFYKEATMTTGNPYYSDVQRASYPFGFYLTFALWNLPVWIIQNALGTNIYNTILVMFWEKILLIVFIFLCANQIFRIVDSFENYKEKANQAVWLFLTSLLTLIYTCSVGQYEIITVFFILVGFEAWLKNNSIKFLVMFAIAFSFKYFAFVLFVPLLLLKEKNILKVIVKTILLTIPTVALMFIFPNASSGNELMFNLLPYFFSIHIDMSGFLSGVIISVYPVVMIILCLWCFLSKPSKDTVMQYAIFAMLVSMGSFCLLAEIYPYWSVLAVPIFVLSIVFSNGNYNKMIALETILCGGLTASFFVKFYWVTGVFSVYATGILQKIFGTDYVLNAPKKTSVLSLVSFISDEKIELARSFLAGFLILIWAVMLYFTYPGRKKYEEFETYKKGPVLIRTAINLIISLIPFLYAVCYFYMNYIK